MSELLKYYQQQALLNLSTLPWVLSLQEAACADFIRLNFPTRHCEDWKYTSVDAFSKERFSIEAREQESHAISPPMSFSFGPFVANDAAIKLDDATSKLPDGVIVMPLRDAVKTHAEKIKPYLGRILDTQHAFHALNLAVLHQGLFVYVPEGVRLTLPLLLAFRPKVSGSAEYIRNLVVAEAGSSLILIEDYQGDDACYFTNTVTEVHLAAKAEVTHYKIQRESKQAFHVGHLAVVQEAGSRFDSHSMSLGGKWVRSDITIHLREPGAKCLMNGIYAPSEGQHVDHHTLVTHDAQDCSSQQDYKGILTGHSRAVFNGRVVVKEHAVHTEAKQQNKNVLLSPLAEIDTKPQLEIFADDVVCTHGATVGQLDEDALFYLAARGIGRKDATRYLIAAFADANLRAISDEGLSQWMGSLLTEQLG